MSRCIFQQSLFDWVVRNPDSPTFLIGQNEDGSAACIPVNGDFQNGQFALAGGVSWVLLRWMNGDFIGANFSQWITGTVVDVQEGGYCGAVAHG